MLTPLDSARDPELSRVRRGAPHRGPGLRATRRSRPRRLPPVLLATALLSGPGPEPPPLYANLGTLHHPITTGVPRAQAYFDQGLRLVFADNHAEAILSFREAIRLDPRCAMCYWGVALALGPNLEEPMAPASARPAFEAVRTAAVLTQRATPREQAYVFALSTRYSADSTVNRGVLDTVYAAAMSDLTHRYPDDQDAAVLYAESLLDLRPGNQWTPEGRPQPGTDEVVAALEGVLTRNPNHAGACHYYIHAVEGSPAPERALECARRLAFLMPGAGHLVQMPAHVYFRMGMYPEAIQASKHAIQVDQAYLAERHPEGAYPRLYYRQGWDFLWAAEAMDGQGAAALEAARGARALWADSPAPYFALARFGRWQDLLAEPEPGGPPYLRAMWAYGRGLALAASGKPAEAQKYLDSIDAVRALPDSVLAGPNPSSRGLLLIARQVLGADIARRNGDLAFALPLYQDAVRLEDALPYDQPPRWYYPVRQSLGTALLHANRPIEAEAVFREDLSRHPHNGWSLFGLERSLEAQNRMAAADSAAAAFATAWGRADVTLADPVF